MKKSKFDLGSRLYLPEEIILKILTSLPAKIIGRCRCVSKKWRTLLSEPNFIKAHLSLSLNNPPHKTLVFDKRSSSFFAVDFHGRTTTDHDDPVVSAAQRIKFDIPDDGYLVFRCSDHRSGLILVEVGDETLFLLNPTTLERREFPKPPAGSIEDFIFGIGNNKAVAINSYDYSVYVYTFISNTAAATAWKRLQIEPLFDHGNVFCRYNNANGVLFNGSICWLGFTFSDPHLLSPLIIAFDLTEETIRAIPVRVPLRSIWGWKTLGVVGGSLCVICQELNKYSSELDVWVMINHEYGMEEEEEEEEEESWTKLLSFYKNNGLHRVIFLGNEELMLISGMPKAVIYNVKQKSSRNTVISELPFDLTEVEYCSTFVDSLVSPRQSL